MRHEKCVHTIKFMDEHNKFTYKVHKTRRNAKTPSQAETTAWICEQTLWLQLTLIIVSEPYSPFRWYCVCVFVWQRKRIRLHQTVFVFIFKFTCSATDEYHKGNNQQQLQQKKGCIHALNLCYFRFHILFLGTRIDMHTANGNTIAILGRTFAIVQSN